MVHTQGEHLYLEILVKGLYYSATSVLRKIRCIKDKHHMQSKYVTWYGHHHLVLLISISKASSWSPSSPARHLDLHHSVVASRSSRQLLLIQLSLTHSDKVKQLHGVCTSYNKETTLRLLPVVNITKHDHLIHQHISHHILTISHHSMPCKNKLDVLYFVVASFTWLLRASSKNRSYLRIKTVKCAVLTLNKDWR